MATGERVMLTVQQRVDDLRDLKTTSIANVAKKEVTTAKRVMLTVQQRMDALRDLKTTSIANVAKKYNVHYRTIWRVQQNAAIITDFASKGKLEKRRKNFKKPKYEELEQRLLVWYIERRTVGDVLSDALLLQKAAELKEEYAECANFKISPGWLAKFKRRHHIRLVHIRDEKSSTDEDETIILNEKIDESRIKESFTDGGKDEYGIPLSQEEREDLEDVFIHLERFRNRISRSACFHLDGLKTTILGDTLPKDPLL